MRDSWFRFETLFIKCKVQVNLSYLLPSETSGLSSMGLLRWTWEGEWGAREWAWGWAPVFINTGSKPKLKPKLINWALTNHGLIPLFHLLQVSESSHRCCLDNKLLTSLVTMLCGSISAQTCLLINCDQLNCFCSLLIYNSVPTINTNSHYCACPATFSCQKLAEVTWPWGFPHTKSLEIVCSAYR